MQDMQNHYLSRPLMQQSKHRLACSQLSPRILNSNGNDIIVGPLLCLYTSTVFNSPRNQRMPALHTKEYQPLQDASFEKEDYFDHGYVHPTHERFFSLSIKVAFVLSVLLNAVWLYQSLSNKAVDVCKSQFGTLTFPSHGGAYEYLTPPQLGSRPRFRSLSLLKAAKIPYPTKSGNIQIQIREQWYLAMTMQRARICHQHNAILGT